MDEAGRRAEIGDAVAESLRQLDGSTASAVALLTGLSRAELDDLGGFDKEDDMGDSL